MAATDQAEGPGVPLYTIGALARLTGVSAQTIRNWERRHGLPQPVQVSPGSHRLYTAAEASLARHLAALVAEGVPIRKAAAVIRAERHSPGRLAGVLEDAVRRLDASAARRTLAEAAAMLPPDQVWRAVVTPVLRALGDDWAGTGTGMAAEHLATGIVRGWLHAAIDALGDAPAGPLIVIACGPGERHELGSLMLALMLRERGVRATYLGADTPLAALEEAISLPALQMLVVTATTPATAALAIETLEALAVRFPPDAGPLIGYCGPGFGALAGPTAQGRVRYLGSELEAATAALSPHR